MNLCILFVTVLGVCCHEDCFSSFGEQGYSLAGVCRLVIAVASLVAEHGFSARKALAVVARGLSSCSSRALEHRLSTCGAWA